MRSSLGRRERPATLAAGASGRSANYVPDETAARSLHGNLAAYTVGYFLVVAVTAGGTLLWLLGYEVGYASSASSSRSRPAPSSSGCTRLHATAVTIAVLVVAASVNVFDLSTFQFLVTLVGGDVLLPGRTTTIGFLAHGMFIRPLFFASIGRYIPGDRFTLRGLAFGTLLWSGFVVFYQGYTGLALAGYLALTLLEGRLLLRPEV